MIRRMPWLSFGFHWSTRSIRRMAAGRFPVFSRTRANPYAARRNGRLSSRIHSIRPSKSPGRALLPISKALSYSAAASCSRSHFISTLPRWARASMCSGAVAVSSPRRRPSSIKVIRPAPASSSRSHSASVTCASASSNSASLCSMIALTGIFVLRRWLVERSGRPASSKSYRRCRCSRGHPSAHVFAVLWPPRRREAESLAPRGFDALFPHPFGSTGGHGRWSDSRERVTDTLVAGSLARVHRVACAFELRALRSPTAAVDRAGYAKA